MPSTLQAVLCTFKTFPESFVRMTEIYYIDSSKSSGVLKENDFAVRQAMGSETTYGLLVHSR